MIQMSQATPDDADALAALHAVSWRSAYRGTLADAYLDGPIGPERRAFWRHRYAAPPAGLWTVVAQDADRRAVGFLCLLADHDARWGTLIDNVHVAPAQKGQGIGRLLMRAAGQHLLGALPLRPLHLFVLHSNAGAIAFYERVGGEAVEDLVKPEPDGAEHPIRRYAWRNAAALLDAVG